jgi:hypothetical protein
MRRMTRRRKLTLAAAAGAAVLVAAGLGAAGAVAGSKIFSPSDESKAIIDDAAGQLGVEPSELTEALEQALENRIDEAVDEGRLTEEQAERLKERLEARDVPLLLGFGGLHRHGFGPGPRGFGFFRSAAVLDAAASYLGLTEVELREALEDSTLAEIAKEKGKTAAGLVNQLVATQTKRIDAAVDEGKLTDEQAAELKEGLDERMEALVDGELRRPGHGWHRFWRGQGAPRAPPLFGGHSG